MKEDRSLKKLQQQPSNQVWRAAASIVKAHVNKITVDEAVKALYPDDPVTPIILRAASTQATLTDVNWAGPLARTAVNQSIEDIVAMTVIGRLEAMGALRVDLGRLASVTVPGRSTSVNDAGTWVGEGTPIPARQMTIYAGATLRPRKLAVIVTMTRELTEASNIEDVLKMLLTEAAGMAIDSAMWSAAASTATKPAGLLNGLVALTPSTGAGFDACGADLGSLVQDIANRGGGRNAFFIASPREASSVHFFSGRFGEAGSLPIAASVGLAAGSVVCIEPESLAFSFSDPQFTISSVAAVQQNDAPSSDLLTGGPVKSMYQIDAYALKMTVMANWGMRAPHISFMSAVTW